MSTDYGINPLMMGNYDWNSIMPYFQPVWQTPNPNFKGGADNAKKADGVSNVNTDNSVKTNDGAIPVTTPAEPVQSSTLANLTGIGAVLAIGGGALYMLKKGNFGKASEVVKSVLNRGKSDSTTSVAGILKKLTAVKGQDNKIKFLIPGKTTTATGETAVTDLTRRYGIESAVSAERMAYSPTASVIESFRYTAAGEKFTVHTKDGVITKIVDEKGNEVLKRFTEAQEKSADAITYQKMDSALKELVKEEKEIDKNLLAGVKNIQYSNTYGDDVLKVYMENYGADPKIKQFTTLERFDFSSNEMQAFVLGSNEKVFANSKFYKDGKLIDGVQVKSFSHNLGGSDIVGNFEGRTLVSVRRPDGQVLTQNSAGYEAIVEQYQKDIDKLLRRVYEKREYIPAGATITTV